MYAAFALHCLTSFQLVPVNILYLPEFFAELVNIALAYGKSYDLLFAHNIHQSELAFFDTPQRGSRYGAFNDKETCFFPCFSPLNGR